MKINLLLFISLCFTSSIFANQLDSIQELLPYDNPEYIGYRIALADLNPEYIKSGTVIKISYTAINTGRKDLLFGKAITSPPNLVVNFDHSIFETGLIRYAEDIRDAILKEDFHLAAGKITKKKVVKIEVNGDEILSNNPVAETTEILENPRIQPSESSADVFMAKGNASPNEQELTPEQELPAKSDSFEDMLKGRPVYDENACSDLEIESIKVLKKSKNKVTLEYTIINKGTGPATIIKDRKNEQKNLALKAHFSTQDKMTKGAFTFDGDFVRDGLKDSNGKLHPGDKYTGTLKLNIQKMTKFTPYIILELDPYLSIRECDKTNNRGAIKVGEGIKGEK